MSNKKFNTQTNYELDVNNTTSKIRLDFDTNVVNPTNAVLGTTSDGKEFVLIDQSLISQVDTDGFKNINVATSNGAYTGSVKNYVFEKLIDPSVAGCENCGTNAKYVPDGVSITGNQIESLDVLPIVNKQVVAEFEVSPEAYHSLEIDLVGHRRICNDSGDCFTSDITTISETARTQLRSNPDPLSALSYATTTPVSGSGDDASKFPPYNAPDHMYDQLAAATRMIDYSCCKCCYFYEEFVKGNITLANAESQCNSTSEYFIGGLPSDFFEYCTGEKNRSYLDYSSKQIENNVSHCALISRKIDQYGSFPDPTLPNCLNSVYETEAAVAAFLKCQILIRCCNGTEEEFDQFDNGDGTFSYGRRCCKPGTTTDPNGDPTDNTCCADCGGGGGGDPCDSNPCSAGCPLDCTLCPSDPRCDPCTDNPCSAGCPLDCTLCPGDPRCVDCTSVCDNLVTCPPGQVETPTGNTITTGEGCICSETTCVDDGGGGGGGGGGTGSTIHCGDITNKSGINFDNEFVLGRCENALSNKNTYMFNRPSLPCTEVPGNINDIKNYCSISANNFKNIFDDVSWHLMGGHFYANKELRDFIYKQTGTIHFSTSVNSNFVSYQSPEDTHSLYHIDTVVANGKEYYLSSEYNITAPSFYDNANAYLSIGNSYIAQNTDGTFKQLYPNVAKEIYYDSNSQNYLSRYSTTDINRIYFAKFDTIPIIAANINKFTRDTATTVSVASSSYSDNTNLVDLGSYISDDQFMSWPLSNCLFSYTSTGRLSHDLQSSNPEWTIYNGTLFHNTITPLVTVKTPTNTISTTTYKKYLVNNGIRQDFTFITDSRNFATASTNYENYKFLGRLVDNETVEISNGNALVDPSGVLLSYNTTGLKSAQILNDIFTFLNIDSQTDPKTITINAYGSDTNSSTTPITVEMFETPDYLDNGTLVKEFSTTGDLSLGTGTGRGIIQFKLDRKVSNFTTAKNYYFMFKVKNPIKGFTDSITNDKTGTFSLTPILVGEQDNSTYQFQPSSTFASRTKPSTLGRNEFNLFTIDSARFATPDYASYDATPKDKKANEDQLVVPMRGLQYQFFKKNPDNAFGVMSEVDDYPVIRTIRKNDGKFYIQILAGAFAYYHKLVHEAVLKKLDALPGAGLSWRNKICNKDAEWYKYIATTKWTCYVKHTEFAVNIPGWSRIQDSSTAGTGTSGKKPTVIGARPQSPVTAAIVTVNPPLNPEEEVASSRGGTAREAL